MISALSQFIGGVLLFLTNIIAVGYFIYNWAVLDVAIKTVAWDTFVLWAALLICGWALYVGGLYFEEDY